MGEINNIFNDIGTIQLRVTFLLARMLHELPSPDHGEERSYPRSALARSILAGDGGVLTAAAIYTIKGSG